MAVSGHLRVPIFTASDPRHPVMTGPIRVNSASSPYLVPQILRLTVHDRYLECFVVPGAGQLFLDTAVHGTLRRYTIASPQPYFLSPCSGVGTGPWVGASASGDLTMTRVDSTEIFHLGSGSHAEETAQLYTFPPSSLSKPPQGKCPYTGPLALMWSRCPAGLQGAYTSLLPPPR